MTYALFWFKSKRIAPRPLNKRSIDDYLFKQVWKPGLNISPKCDTKTLNHQVKLTFKPGKKVNTIVKKIYDITDTKSQLYSMLHKTQM